MKNGDKVKEAEFKEYAQKTDSILWHLEHKSEGKKIDAFIWK